MPTRQYVRSYAAGPCFNRVEQLRSGAIGVNVHVAPAAGAVEFGFSNSATALPTIWTAGLHVNSDLWGAYVPTPASAGTWYAWAEGTDGSSPTVYPTPFTVA